MPALTPEFLALQQAVAGRYSLDRELGRGGMGVVFLARDVALDRPVAIKLLPPALAADPGARARFLREARAAARLSHPHIVPVHAVEERGDLAFFVMAYVDGETLGARVRRAGPLPPAEAMRVVQEVAWALAHAHAHGVVHRDVKPDNILLEREGGRALVTDFGIAHVADVHETPAGGQAVGTPHYMSPEQAAGEPADARSDLYALGVTAFVAATGRHPFDGASAAAVLVQHATVPAPPLLARRPSLPPRFAAAVDRCLAKRPADRWPSADALGAALREARATLPETPAPVRAFLREADQAGGEMGTALTATATSVVVLGLGGSTALPFGSYFAHIIVMLVYSGIAVLTASLVLVRGAQLLTGARSLLRRGYGHAALAPALVAEQRERDAEREADALGGAPGARADARERWALAGIGAVKTAISLWLVGADVPTGLGLLGIAGSIVVPTVTVRMLWRGWPRGARLWHRLVSGAPGRAAFRIAGLGLDASRTALPAAGEPTVAVLGRAAEQLFAALPAAQQARFREVPALVARLQEDAARLRERTDDPAAADRLALTVAALEALRLDLLQLHAGAGSFDELTRDVEAARDLGRRVDAELAARDELRGTARGELTPA